MALESHSELTAPPDDTVLWRYLNFAKFLHFLESQSLLFFRPDQFEDPLEGTYTDGELRHLHSLGGTDDSARLGVLDGYLGGPKYMRTTAYVSCWRAGARESLAMWDLYGKGSGVVAVKTTVAKLKLAIAESSLRIFLGKVQYIDWSDSTWANNGLVMCFRKDASYRHEAEVRAIIWDPDQISRNMSAALVASRAQTIPCPIHDPFILRKGDGEQYIQLPVAMEDFITEIVVGPREKPWIYRLVKEVLKRYKLEIKITVSNRLTPR